MPERDKKDMLLCNNCSTFIPPTARVCPNCTRDVSYGSGDGSGFISGIGDLLALAMVATIFFGIATLIYRKQVLGIDVVDSGKSKVYNTRKGDK